MVLYLLAPLVLLRLALRGFRSPAYWRRWSERFGIYSEPQQPIAIWIHAVSVGEVQATLPLMQLLRERIDVSRILITTMTPTGSDRVRVLYGDAPVHVYAPYDLSVAVRRFMGHFRPGLAMVMETEVWPNLFFQCGERGVPLFMVNARMSERSFRGYRRVQGLTTQTLGHVTKILAQGLGDQERLIALGAAPDRVHVTGSVKFDIRYPPSLLEQAAALRRIWGVDRPVWIAASTHEGEDEIVLAAHKEILSLFPDAFLVLVPRHPERFPSVAALCRQKGFSCVLRSEEQECAVDTQVFVGDTMGELATFFAASDVAFIGGSLLPSGGHNPLEAAALGTALVFGPHMFNFSDASRWLLEANAAVQVETAQQLAQGVGYWLENANARHEAGQKGCAVVNGHKGAVLEVIKMLEPYIEKIR